LEPKISADTPRLKRKGGATDIIIDSFVLVIAILAGFSGFG